MLGGMIIYLNKYVIISSLIYNKFTMFSAELYSQWVELRGTHSELGPAAQNHVTSKSRYQFEHGHFTSTEVSMTPGFISLTSSKASGTFKFAAATLWIRMDSTVTKRNEVN